MPDREYHATYTVQRGDYTVRMCFSNAHATRIVTVRSGLWTLLSLSLSACRRTQLIRLLRRFLHPIRSTWQSISTICHDPPATRRFVLCFRSQPRHPPGGVVHCWLDSDQRSIVVYCWSDSVHALSISERRGETWTPRPRSPCRSIQRNRTTSLQIAADHTGWSRHLPASTDRRRRGLAGR